MNFLTSPPEKRGHIPILKSSQKHLKSPRNGATGKFIHCFRQQGWSRSLRNSATGSFRQAPLKKRAHIWFLKTSLDPASSAMQLRNRQIQTLLLKAGCKKESAQQRNRNFSTSLPKKKSPYLIFKVFPRPCCKCHATAQQANSNTASDSRVEVVGCATAQQEVFDKAP